MSGPFGEIEVDPRTPFGSALFAAQAAFDQLDLRRMDEQYRYAVRFAPAQPPSLWVEVAAEHVSRLRALNDSTTALARCEEHLVRDSRNVRLRLLRAETDLVLGDHSRIDDDITEIRRIVGGQPDRWVEAPLSRLEGLAAARRGAYPLALERLRHARATYVALRDDTAVAVVDDDIRAVAAPDPSPSAPDATPQARLTRAEELRLAGLYEKALGELQTVLDGSLDPALRYHFLDAKVRLLRILRADVERKLMQELYAAARASAQPGENEARARRLDSDVAAELQAPPPQSDPGLRHIHSLILAGHLDDAARLLLTARLPAESNSRHAAQWHFAAGELAMDIARGSNRGADVARRAVVHFGESARHASASSLVAIRIPALRMLGDAYEALDEMDHAAESWAGAHRLEETVAALLSSDELRLPFLSGAPDEFDKRIGTMDRVIEAGNGYAAAAVVVAMESARGAAILDRILRGQVSLVRDLPPPSDIAGACRWVRDVARTLPRSQAVWMLHATPDHVHHAFVGRSMLRHVSVPCERIKLVEAIGALTACWGGGQEPTSIDPVVFDRCLQQVAELLGLRKLSPLPGNVRRIAVIAGGDLLDIPFAALPSLWSPDTLLGRRYALSVLPCLSVRLPLAHRSRRQRGMRMLLLSPAEEFKPATGVRGRRARRRQDATKATLRDELVRRRYQHVRIDCHGEYKGDPAKAVIQLAPAGSAGAMSPGELQAMRGLDECGTLVLGACETGMIKRVGRDEHTGFVRAALLSGASAVLVARWNTPDRIAARVLDGFDRYLRHHPRDVALFLAQRDEDIRGGGRRPHAWACWTLYGDPGHQARCAPLQRWLPGGVRARIAVPERVRVRGPSPAADSSAERRSMSTSNGRLKSRDKLRSIALAGFSSITDISGRSPQLSSTRSKRHFSGTPVTVDQIWSDVCRTLRSALTTEQQSRHGGIDREQSKR